MIYTRHSESSRDLESHEPIYEQDAFLNEHGYAWDYVLVFPMSTMHRKPSIEDICHRLHAAGLSLKLFYSSMSKNKAVRRLVFCLVRAPPDLLMKEADRISLNMLLDERALMEAALQGYPLQNIQPFPIQDTLGLYDMGPYTSIHIKYSCRDDMQRLYLKRGPMNSLFSSTQRMLLTKSIMTNTHGGAGLDLYKILHNNTLAAFYPAHEPTERSELAAAWLSWHFWPWQQPLSSIQSYFGSKIALYFAFLAHYTTWLMGAGVVGLGLWIPQLVLPNSGLRDQVVVGCSSVWIVIWATLLMKSWGRYNATLAFHWGTTNFQATEQPRPQFVGRLVPSPITGRPMLYFDKREKLNRMCWSWLLLCGLIGLVAGLVSMNFYLQNYLIEAKYSIRVGSWDFLIGGPVANLANVAQIAVMFQIYDSVCVQLNEIENHATESEHEGAFILKSILFHVINNFAALFYVMFVKRYIGVQCMNNDCLGELRISLLFIFGLQMLWGNLQQVLLPRLWSLWTACRVGHPQDHIHPLEEEFYLADYGWLGTFYDYLELVLQFGYTILFIGAFPATPLLSLINNVCEIRIDAYRLLNEYRRPTPRQAATAGQWVTVLEVLVTLSIFTNGFFLVYSSNVFDFPDNTIEGDLAKLRLFVLYVATLLLFRYSVSRYWENVPERIQVQLKRQDFLSSKILGREADEVVPQFVRSESFQFKIDSMDNRPAFV
ncbi:hypothetical protein H310_11681 [Aphanomyces invadans]|uniref:Anoctamin dimerisation domain-containing protein n=1 Tax=Aphanomyces invadans TaxID=157072 RepID=A0A024TKZ0_9STRA|nr:hypothetical protein H310_11681 [Aphanomyces invadans]ETV94708.1 hypothetical protein H310_11681 [Aphanomyces invadans]|eukprot:XP_008876653.1 hypothetical protein H310_11681 [Aphanomyces invadans]